MSGEYRLTKLMLPLRRVL